MLYSKRKQQPFSKTERLAMISQQNLKICVICKKPFCKKQGRAKQVKVEGCRYICAACAE